MKRLLTILFIVNICFVPASSQSTWSRIKEKAKSAWNSDTRKNAWKKTKEVSEKALEDYRYKVPVTERTFINVIPDDYLLSLSSKQYRSVVSSGSLSSKANEKERVKRVAQRLSKAVEQLYRQQGMQSELRNFHWEFNLIKGSTVNAFCMPGGKIAVYEGIMPIANDDASLAVVLGHEIAHAMAKHSAEHMTKGLITAVGVTGIYIMISTSDMSERKKLLAKMLASAGATLANLKFSRENETEADRIGLILAAMAGYDPEAAIPFWKRMGEKSGSTSKRDWYSTHPSNYNRIENIRSFLPEAKRYYKKK